MYYITFCLTTTLHYVDQKKNEQCDSNFFPKKNDIRIALSSATAYKKKKGIYPSATAFTLPSQNAPKCSKMPIEPFREGRAIINTKKHIQRAYRPLDFAERNEGVSRRVV